jgi:hypothetical protein
MRIDAEKHATAIAAAIEAAYTPLAARIAALEQRPTTGGVKWAGIYTDDRIYAAGDLVTRSGLWLALRDTAATPGSDPTCWKLICKQSR